MVCSSFGLCQVTCIWTGNLYLDLIVAWPLGEASAVLRTFLDFLSANEDAIRAKAELILSSIARNRS